MDASPFTRVAKVVKTRGLDGEVTVTLLVGTEPSAVLSDTPLWPVPPRWVPRPLHTQSIGSAGTDDKAVVAFQEIRDVATARRLVGAFLLARTEHLPKETVRKTTDLRGVTVVDVTRGPLGDIDEVVVTGANDVWVVHGPFGEVLVPVIPDVVLELDAEGRTALVRLLPGLIDEE